MNWIYHIIKKWDATGYAPAQQLLARAWMENENGEQMVSNIIELNVFAMDFYFGLPDNPLSTPQYQQIYHEELEKKDYFMEEIEIDEKEDYMLKRCALYLKGEKFDKVALLQWLSTCLSIWGFEQSDFEETDMTGFAEMNFVLQMFSIKNAQKFEDKFGKEWWKQKDK
jgi:hypothetical protein